MLASSLALLLLAAWPTGTRAQSHFTNCVSNTGSDATLIVPLAAAPSLNGVPLETDDEIAVFTTDGLCAGFLRWTEIDAAFTIWGDDSLTPEKDGFVAGEALAFRLWDASEGREVPNDGISVTYDDRRTFYRTEGTFAPGAIYALRRFEARQAPDVPTLTEPAHGAADVGRDLVLRWSPAAYATAYDVEVSVQPDFSSLVAQQREVTTTSYQANGLAYGTRYYWRVRATGGGGTSAWSAVWSFTVEDEPLTPPDAPLPAEPVAGAKDLDTQVTIAWNAVPDALYYTLQLATDPAFQTLTYEQDGLRTTSVDVPALVAGTTYYWRVSATGHGGTSPWSTVRSFSTRPAPPAPPSLLHPAHAATDQPRTPTLTWQATAGADTYTVQVSTDAAFGTLVEEATEQTTTSYTTSVLDYATTYFWRVRASGTTGTGAWSATRSFTVRAAPLPPAAPSLLAPEDGAASLSLPVTLTWAATERATTYTLHLARSADFAPLELVQTDLSEPALSLDQLDPGTTYFWRVRASGDGGDGAWSATRSFSTQPAPPAAPLPAAPRNGASGLNPSVSLQWNPVPGARSFRVQLDRSPAFDNPLLDQSTSATSLTTPALDLAATFFWRVQASGDGGDGAWSETWSFSTRPAPPAAPSLRDPADAATALPTSVAFSWNPSDGAHHYTLQLATSADFTTLTVQQTVSGTSSTIDALDHGTTYFWRVRASGDGGDGAWSATRSFSTQPAPPAAPLPAAPRNGASGLNPSVSLQWNPVPGARSFRVQLDRSPAFDNPLLDQSTSATSLTTPALDLAATFFWRVQASGDGGDGAWSETWSFSTRPAPPAAPSLRDPADAATALPTSVAFSWNPSDGAHHYTLQLATSADFSVIAAGQTTTDTHATVSGLTYETTYFWRVQASGDGGDGAWSATRSFTTEAAPPPPLPPPATPTLTAPSDGARDIPLSTTLTWNHVSGADTYDVQVATTPGFDVLWIDEVHVTNPVLEIDGLDHATTYYWRVRAHGEGGSSDWSGAWHFTTRPPLPSPPVPTAPTDGLTVLDSEVSLAWTPVDGATAYAVEVATTVDFTTPMVQQELTETTLVVRGLEAGTTYRWRVRARNSSGWSAWSPTQHFTTAEEAAKAPKPGRPHPIRPLDRSTGHAPDDTRLAWSATENTAAYTVQLAEEATFLVVAEYTVTDTTLAVEGLAHETTYFWRIQAHGPGGSGDWSDPWTFTTAPPPPPDAPVLESPTAGATDQPLTLVLTWHVVAGATAYDVEIAPDAAFRSVTVRRTALTTTSLTVSNLAEATTYHWRVRASGPTGTGDWSTPARFTTRRLPPAAPTLEAPDDAAVDLPPQVTLRWTPDARATTYTVQVAATPSFTSLRYEREVTTPHAEIDSLDFDATYYWRVRATGPGGASDWSAIRVFRTATLASLLPEAPILTDPADDRTDVPTSVVLSWQVTTGAQTYTVQLATDDAFEQIAVQRTGVSGNTLSVSGLAYGTTYFWRVRGHRSAAAGPWSEARRFTTAPAPPPTRAPRPASPTHEARETPTILEFFWSALDGAETYSFQLSRHADFRSVVAQQSNLDRTTLMILGLNHATTYFWRIRAHNASGTGPWSDVQSFTTVAAFQSPRPTAPVLLTPVHEARDVPGAITLTWRSVSGATAYQFELSTDSTFQALAAKQTHLTAPAVEVADLEKSTRYYWRVRAKSPQGDSPWSLIFSFVTSTTVATEGGPDLPETLELLPAFPNPFDHGTTLMLRLPEPGHVTARVYDALGREVATLADRAMPAGIHRLQWLAAGQGSGLYFCRVQVGNVVLTRRMMRLR